MQSRISVLADFYRELVGPEGSRDLPQTPPAEGFYFCPMLTVSGLWASIRFYKLDQVELDARVAVYVPGADPGGQDAEYLVVLAQEDQSSPIGASITYRIIDTVSGRDPSKLSECNLIAIVFKQAVERVCGPGSIQRLTGAIAA